jgi:hypothetical protein
MVIPGGAGVEITLRTHFYPIVTKNWVGVITHSVAPTHYLFAPYFGEKGTMSRTQ